MRWFAEWNSAIAEAVDTLGGHAFPLKLHQAVEALIDFDFFMVFSYGPEGTVRCLYNNVPADEADLVIETYLAGQYLLDPFYEEVKSGRRTGFRSLRDMAPDRFYRSEYYQRHYKRTNIRDEMGVFFPLASNVTGVLSITRPKQKQSFSSTEKATFAAGGPMVQVLCSEYWSARADRHAAQAPSYSIAKNAIETAFEQFGRDLLSEREREVVAYVLKGHSTKSIGLHLEISVGTVKNHRRNAYAKLGICSQAELFSAFVSSLHS